MSDHGYKTIVYLLIFEFYAIKFALGKSRANFYTLRLTKINQNKNIVDKVH